MIPLLPRLLFILQYYKMTQNRQKKRQEDYIQTTMQALARLINLKFNCLKLLALQRGKLKYRLQAKPEGIPIHWVFKITQKQTILSLHPDFENTYGRSFKIDNQGLLVDLLKNVIKKNFQNDRWTIYLNQSNQVFIKRVFDCKVVSQQIYKNFDNLLRQVINLFYQLFVLIKPYVFQEMPGYKSQIIEQPISNVSTFNKLISLLILLQIRKSVRNSKTEFEQKKTIHIDSNKLNFNQQVLNYIEKNRKQAAQQLQSNFNLLKINSQLSYQVKESIVKNTEISFKRWLQGKRLDQKKYKNDQKNVFGITQIQQISINQKKQGGGHCEVVVGNFKLVVLASINNSTNKSFQKSLQGKNLPYNKELELAIKYYPQNKKQSIQNTFLNQLNFIQYIKDRKCRYIAQYYWQVGLQKNEMKRIFIQFYPKSLRQSLYYHDNDQIYFDMQNRFAIIRKITSALSWLTDNYVCHRDLKPQNIMLTKNFTPKIIDFGSCCPVNSCHSKTNFTVHSLKLIPTVQYCKLYQNLSENVKQLYSKASYQQHVLYDVYSLGKIMNQTILQSFKGRLDKAAPLLDYLISRCEEQVPDHRPTYQQIEFILYELMNLMNIDTENFV